MRQTFRSSTDNGEEFRGSEFEAYLTKYKIKHLYTSPGHPQTNGKVERLNHELVQRLQRISAEDHHQLEYWDEYLPQALHAFHAHKNQRMGCSPFYLQYGVEPVLPPHLSYPPPRRLWSVRSPRRIDVRASRTSTNIAPKQPSALEKLAKNRDNTAFLNDPIMPGDLVMREPLNRKSKLHPRWDGRFVIGSSEKDVFQLAIFKINVLACAQTSNRSPKSGRNSAKKSRTFVRLGGSARHSRKGPQRQELQLGCAEHLYASRICDLKRIHGDLGAWRTLRFCYSFELKITFKVCVRCTPLRAQGKC